MFNKIKNTSILNYLVKEAIIWYSLPLLFLTVYVGQHHNPFSAITYHLYAITLIALPVALLKICIDRFIYNRTITLFLASWLYATALFSLIIYYGLVIVGLKSWGKVISQELIVSYALQIHQLCDAINISFLLSMLLLCAVYLTFCAGYYFVLKKLHAPLTLSTIKTSATLINVLLLSLLLFALHQLENYFLTNHSASKDPFMLTLYAGSRDLATNKAHRIPMNTQLDKLEDAVRAQYQVTTRAQKKNVILIVADALRPDHMGIYGYQRETTPYLSELKNTGRLIKIDNVQAACSASACGLSSIASSRFTHQLPSHAFTLQQVLQRYDYKINMILGGDHTNFYNLRELYGKVNSYFDGSMAKGYYMNDDTFIIDKVKTLPKWDNSPTMFQFHLMSTHTAGKHLSHFETFKPHQSYANKLWRGSPKQEHTNHYDNGVLQADAVIKELLYLLKNKNYLTNTIVIITADHGEGLGEHHMFGHANSVREELLRIPLLFLDFSKDKDLDLNQSLFAMQIDIAPTILHDLNIPIPTSWAGHPLQRVYSDTTITDITFFQLEPDVGLYDRRNPNHIWKYWLNTYSGDEYVFDLKTDPKEDHNLILQIPASLKSEWRKIAYSTQTH